METASVKEGVFIFVKSFMFYKIILKVLLKAVCHFCKIVNIGKICNFCKYLVVTYHNKTLKSEPKPLGNFSSSYWPCCWFSLSFWLSPCYMEWGSRKPMIILANHCQDWFHSNGNMTPLWKRMRPVIYTLFKAVVISQNNDFSENIKRKAHTQLHYI